MKHAIKFLSVVLALVLTCSAFVFPVGAAGEDVEITYSVEKYFGPDIEMGATADDIYALTVYVKNTNPINYLLLPIYYRTDLFTPIDGTDMSIMNWDYTISFDDGLVRAGYNVPEGSDLADTNKYTKASVAAADRKVNSRGAISGLGKGSVDTAIGNLDARDPSQTAWYGSLDTNKYGVVTLQYNPQNNYCNLQAYGVETPLLQIFFKRNADVTDADVEGAEFGYVPGATVRNDAAIEEDVLKFYYDKTSTAAVASVAAGYCTVEAPAVPTSIVQEMKGQIRFDKNADGSYAGTFDVRAIARITGTDFDATFGSIAAAKEMITSVGFVFAQGSGDYAEMVAVAEAGESGNGYTYAPVDFISTSFDPGNYTFSCIVDDVDNKNDSLVALAYITYVDADGETQTAVYTDVQTVSFADLYDRNFNSVFGA